MRRIIGVVFILLVVAGGFYLYQNNGNVLPTSNPSPSSNGTSTSADPNAPAITVIAENLDTPWEILFLPEGSMLVTERNGRVVLIENDNQTDIGRLENAYEIGEGGLMGMALHPDFQTNNLIYFYYTYSSNEGNTLNRVVRMTYENDQLSKEEIIVDAIPGASNHNGGRIAFGPDNYLYITTGDAQEPSQSQDTDSLAGKILRVTEDGDPAPGNPFGNEVYSYGHRNPQGLAWDDQGRLWSTEHGRSGIVSGLDELNWIQAGQNYGWPDYEGDDRGEDIVAPVVHSGSTTTWAPAGAAFLNGSVYFGGLRGQTLYQALLQSNELIESDAVIDVREHLNGQYGRIRAVVTGPDNMLYISTSNEDGRGNPAENDDRIIRVNPQKL